MDGFFGMLTATGTVIAALLQTPAAHIDLLQTSLIENKPGQSMFIQTQGVDEDINIISYEGSVAMVAKKSGGFSAITGDANFQAGNLVHVRPAAAETDWEFGLDYLNVFSNKLATLETEAAPHKTVYRLETLPGNGDKGSIMTTAIGRKSSPVIQKFRAVASMSHLNISEQALGPFFSFEGKEAAWGAYPYLGYYLKDLLPHAKLVDFNNGALSIQNNGSLYSRGGYHGWSVPTVTSSNDLVLTRESNTFFVAGLGKIRGISLYDDQVVELWKPSDHVTLIFTGTSQVFHNIPGNVSAPPILLNKSVDAKFVPGSVLDLVFDGVYWRESGRSTP